MIRWINEINTTSFRILATVGLIYLTGLRYMASGASSLKDWTPAWEWLVFLLMLAGVEGVVLIAKRMTDYKYKEIEASKTQPTVNVDTANVKAGDVTVTPQQEG